MTSRAGRAWAAVLAAVASVLVLLAACGGSDDGATDRPSSAPVVPTSGGAASPTGPTAAPVHVHVAGVVATGLHAPWGIAFLPDGSALVSQRDDDTVVRVTPRGSVSTVGTVSGVDGSGEGGLLGIALAPAYPEDPSLYAYFTAGGQNVVARMTYAAGRLSDQRQIFGGIPSGTIHNGGRIGFGPDGMLYVGTGEAGRGTPAQDPDDLGGKILRLTSDGRPAPGNPTPGSPVWTLGHRNVQGFAWDARGRMWASEFGQNTWDELNHIVAGDNYGWPVVEGRGHTERGARFHDPVRVWHTDVASPSGIAIADGSVFMASLRGERLWQIPLLTDGVGTPRALLAHRYGRLRAVAVAPDGSLWVLTNNTDGRGSPRTGDDRIVRLTLSSGSSG
jgi:glucose/arabinose dehydrogenase